MSSSTGLDDPYSLENPDALADPYPLYRRLRDEDPIHWNEFHQTWLVARYEDELAGLSDDEAFSARADRSVLETLAPDVREDGACVRRHFDAWPLFSDPPEHTRRRGAVQHLYTSRAIAGLLKDVEARAELILDEVEVRRSLEVVTDFCIPLLHFAVATLFGADESVLDEAPRWAEELLEFMNVEPGVEETRRAAQVVVEVKEFVRRTALSADSAPDSLLAVLTAAIADGTLDEDEAAAMVAQNLTGGLGAASQLIANGLLALAHHPEQLERLRQNPELATPAIEELLRFDSPFLFVVRTASREVAIRGAHISPGDVVGFLVGAANRDPRQFPRPDELDVGRRRNPHLAFGYGSHYCLGAQFSRGVATIGISSLVRRFSDIKVRDAEVERAPLVGMRWLKRLPMDVQR